MHGRSRLIRQSPKKIGFGFENWLCIVGGTELMHDFPTVYIDTNGLRIRIIYITWQDNK
jgi:hypothetical protein